MTAENHTTEELKYTGKRTKDLVKTTTGYSLVTKSIIQF